MGRLLQGWYNLTIPTHISTASPAGRERMRYARLISLFTGIILLIATIDLIMLFITNNITAALGTSPVILFFVFLLFLNRRGWIIAAGICAVSAAIIAEITPLMMAKAVDVSLLPVLNYLVIALILAGAILPPVAVPFVAAVNCSCIVLTFVMLPHTQQLHALLGNNGMYSLMVPPIILQIVVAVIIYVIMQNLLKTIRRADRAEEIAELQKEIATYERTRAQEKQQLEESIQKIAQIHTQIANGNLDARVSLSESNVLWNIAIPLNNLLSRVQRLKYDADQYARTQLLAQQIAQYLQDARLQHRPVHLNTHTGTLLDPVLIEVNHMADKSMTTRGL